MNPYHVPVVHTGKSNYIWCVSMSPQYYLNSCILLWHLPVKLLLVDNTHCFADVINISFSSAGLDALMLTMHSDRHKMKKTVDFVRSSHDKLSHYWKGGGNFLCQSLLLLKVSWALCSLQRLGVILYHFNITETQQEVRHWMHVLSVQPDSWVRPSLSRCSRV